MRYHFRSTDAGICWHVCLASFEPAIIVSLSSSISYLRCNKQFLIAMLMFVWTVVCVPYLSHFRNTSRNDWYCNVTVMFEWLLVYIRLYNHHIVQLSVEKWPIVNLGCECSHSDVSYYSYKETDYFDCNHPRADRDSQESHIRAQNPCNSSTTDAIYGNLPPWT